MICNRNIILYEPPVISGHRQHHRRTRHQGQRRDQPPQVREEEASGQGYPFCYLGGFASCYLVENIETKRQFAAKIISKTTLMKPKTKQKLLSEIRIHKSVTHKHIVQFYHVFENEYNVYILLEVCSNSNMFELIKERKKLTIP